MKDIVKLEFIGKIVACTESHEIEASPGEVWGNFDQDKLENYILEYGIKNLVKTLDTMRFQAISTADRLADKTINDFEE